MARDLYVFVQLSGQVSPVVAGRFTLSDNQSPAVGHFVYAQSYLARPDAVSLDPVALPLRAAEFTTSQDRGYFGILRDALPDDWGRRLAQALGTTYASDFDLLLAPARDRFGALRFGRTPKAPVPDEPVPQLDELRAALLESLERADRQVPLSTAERDAIIAVGIVTSAGGARPKVTVKCNGALHLLKLPRADDQWVHARIEAALLDLAERAGIAVPGHDVITVAGREALLVQRFDRELTLAGEFRQRAVSAYTVFRADEAYYQQAPYGSYPRLARELERWGTELATDRRELFRRVAFNCVTGLTDDHARNHALVAIGPHFRLSPAYDLSPPLQTTQRRIQALQVGALGSEASRVNMLTSAAAYGLAEGEANALIDDVVGQVQAHWRACLQHRLVASATIDRFAYNFDLTFFEAVPEPASELSLQRRRPRSL